MNNKTISAAPIIKDVFKYYKLLIMSVFSICVVSTAFTKLGALSGGISLIILILIYFGIITIDMFQTINEANLTPLVSYNQATKTCSSKSTSTEKHGLLYNTIFGKKGGGVGGDNFAQEFKKLSKQMVSSK